MSHAFTRSGCRFNLEESTGPNKLDMGNVLYAPVAFYDQKVRAVNFLCHCLSGICSCIDGCLCVNGCYLRTIVCTEIRFTHARTHTIDRHDAWWCGAI